MYFDAKLSTYVKYIPRKSKMVTLQTVELYAVTSSTNRELLKKKLNYYKEFSNGKEEYLAKSEDLKDLSREQINKVKDAVPASASEVTPKKKPDLNVYIPFHKIGIPLSCFYQFFEKDQRSFIITIGKILLS
jgi:hypothetical protein